MSAPFVWIYVCFAAGVLAGSHWTIGPWLAAGSVLCAAASLFSTNFRLAFSAQALMFLILGQQFCSIQEKEYHNELRAWVKNHENDTVPIRGVVLGTPEITPEYFTIRTRILSVAHQNISGMVRLTVSGSATRLPQAGDVIETYGRLRIPVTFRAEGSFDYEKYLMKEGIHALGSVKSESILKVTGERKSLIFWFSRVRLGIIQRIQSEFSPPDASILRALWLDDRSGLSHETEQRLIDAGIYHVIAISGFHIAVVLFLCFLLLKKLVPYRVALLILAMFLLFYFLLLEGRSSITRSFLTFLILSFSVWRYETLRWDNTLFLSALIQLLINPLELFDPGYQLTYLSTAAILFIAAPLARMVHLRRSLYQWTFDFLITTIAIQFILFPYQVYSFHKIPIVSLLANWAAVPLSSCLIAIGLVTIPLPFLYHPFSPVIHLILRWFVDSANFFGGIRLSMISQPSLFVIVLFYGSIILFLCNKKWFSRLMAVLVCSGSVLLVFFSKTTDQKDYFRVHFIDVGQGDAILLEYPDGTFDLVDSGGSWNREALDIGESVLIPYLAFWKVEKIHRVFLTHAHADHMNGFFSLFRYVPVQEFYVTRKPYGDPAYQALLRHIPSFPRSVRAGDRFQQAGVEIQVLAPEDSRKTLKVGNDDSMVLLLRFQGKRLLLPGDAEKVSEDKLLNINNLDVDYLKSPHHGSRTSSTEQFLDKLKMKVVFISVGKNNWFGHPHPEVIKRYRARHAMIYRTDQIGTIRLTMRPGQDEIDSYAWSHLPGIDSSAWPHLTLTRRTNDHE